MAKVTKLQLDTLDKKLTRIIRDKEIAFEKQRLTNLTANKQAELIFSGEVKLKKKMPQGLSLTYSGLQADTVFDFSKYEDIVCKNRKVLKEYREKLYNKKQDILDAYVLQGLDDIKEMIKELEEFEVK